MDESPVFAADPRLIIDKLLVIVWVLLKFEIIRKC